MDLAALIGQKDELVGRLRQAKYADVAAAHGFEVRPGQARFIDQTTLTVGGHTLFRRRTAAHPVQADCTASGHDGTPL